MVDSGPRFSGADLASILTMWLVVGGKLGKYLAQWQIQTFCFSYLKQTRSKLGGVVPGIAWVGTWREPWTMEYDGSLKGWKGLESRKESTPPSPFRADR